MVREGSFSQETLDSSLGAVASPLSPACGGLHDSPAQRGREGKSLDSYSSGHPALLHTVSLKLTW